MSLLVFVVFSVAVSISVDAGQSQADTDSSSLTLRQREIEKQRRRLSSTDAEERRDAVMQLGSMKHPDGSRAVVIALNDPVPVVRATAASAVLSLPSVEAVAVLKPLLNDKKEFVRQQIAYALGETRSIAAVEGLVATLEGDKMPSVRGAAAVALGMIADQTAAAQLARIIDPGFAAAPAGSQKTRNKREDDSFVQRSAAHSLGQMRSRSAVPALVAAMANKRFNNDVRREVALALRLIGDVAAVPALRVALTSKDPYLARIAYEALLDISPSDVPSH